jgi:hypothetical protein
VIERSKPAIEKVMRFKGGSDSSYEVPAIEEIFQTEAGIRFGGQVDQVLEFAMKGNLLTLFSSMVPFLEGVFQAIGEGAFSKVIQKQEEKPPIEDIQIVADLESLAYRVNGMDLKEGLEALPTTDDGSWYFSLVVFALYTYLDVYTRALIDTIGTNKMLSSKIVSHLSEIAERRSDKSRPAVLDVKGMKRFGVERRLVTIERGLSIDSVLHNAVGKEELDNLRKGISKFVEIRGKVAHSNPKLDHEEYTFKELEEDLDEIDIDFSEFDGFIERIGFAQYGLPQIKDATVELGGVLNKTRLILLTAVVYPALIDAVLQALLDTV